MKKVLCAILLSLAGLAHSLPNLLVSKIVVQVGPDGTDDDVTMKICDTSKCCTTKTLSHLLSSEWVKDKLETWDGSKLGNCSQILFDSEARKLDVTVNKATKKKDSLDVTSVTLEAAPASDKKKVKKFQCGSFKLKGTDSQKTSVCPGSGSTPTRGPSKTKDIPIKISRENYKIGNVIVQMGDDGTNDDVSMKVCEANSKTKCCDTGKLSGLLSDDWSKNDKETWKNKDLGGCKNSLWNACKGLDVTLTKKAGKDVPESEQRNCRAGGQGQ
eukprot:TRINITY_DN2294_c0_g1_i10.p1 TRINITY_DN2294_c0_g1~~TRINITY_DN2294_c0_g1_i10.p1  ORF type:complete len:271 (-),score=78.36 TRINITY_DN2294_c0_g1_i10:26-838(-)